LGQRADYHGIYQENYTAICNLKKERQKFRYSHSALIIFDVFKGQCTDNVLKLLEENNIQFVVVPTIVTAQSTAAA